MGTKDHFIDWLRGKVLGNQQEPPADSWEEISEALDLEESWGQIEEELELNTVWDQVDQRLSSLASMEKFEKWTNRSSLAAVLLLLLISFQQLPPGQNADKEQNINRQPAINSNEEGALGESLSPLGEEEPTLDENEKGAIYEEDKKDNKEHNIDNEITELTGGAKRKTIRSATSSLADVGLEKNSIEKSKAEYAGERISPVQGKGYLGEQVASTVSVVRIEEVTLLPEEGEKENTSASPSIYIGASSAVKVSWLLNRKTMYAMERNTLVKAAPSYQNDYAFLAGLKLHNRLSVQADFYWQNMVGQVYEEYRAGRYGEVEEVLRYRSLALSLSWLQKEGNYGKITHLSRLLGGIYGGRLMEGEEKFAGESEDKTSDYGRYHLGLLTGLEQDAYLMDRLVFTYGLRGRLDLFNIYSGTEYMPATFERTRSFSLDLAVSLKYILKK